MKPHCLLLQKLIYLIMFMSIYYKNSLFNAYVESLM